MDFKRKSKGKMSRKDFKHKQWSKPWMNKKKWTKKKMNDLTWANIKNPQLASDRTGVKFRWFGRSLFTAQAFPLTLTFGANTLGGNGIDWSNMFSQQDPIFVRAWGQFYVKFLVLGSKIRAKITNLDTGSDIIFSVYPSTVTTPTHAASDVPPYIENAYCKWKAMSIAGGSASVEEVENYMITNKVTGDPYEAMLTESDFYGTMSLPGGGNLVGPNNAWYWLLNVTNGANGGTHTFAVEVEITFFCNLVDRRDNSQL